MTGGIGSGKSLVCRLFSLLGAPVYAADDRAKWLMAHDEALRARLVEAFGAETYDADGHLHRAHLAARVFNDPARLETLNALVHPRVATDYAAWVATHRHAPYVLKEAALLYEAGSYRTLDAVLVVHADEALRIGRVRRRDPHRDEAQIRHIMAQQWPEAEKVRRADHLIRNDGTVLVIPQVLALHAAFQVRDSSQ